MLAVPKYNLRTGKREYTINGKGAYKIVSSALLDPTDLPFGSFMVPCGNCIGCRLEYSRQWANRCMLELKYSKSAYYLTLTYDDENVPVSYYGNPDSGEAMASLTLNKRDWQLFMKRLRRQFEPAKLRFFMAGEYGSSTMRPHYHAIIFNLELSDLVLYSKQRGNDYFTSKTVTDIWSKGHVVIGAVTWESCAYVARYVMSKLKGQASSFYEQYNIIPPFTLMSRRPGIGRQYYDDNPDMFDTEFINISTPSGGRSFRHPLYFKKLLAIDNPEKADELSSKAKRFSLSSAKIKCGLSDLMYMDALKVSENSKLNSIKKLRRSDV